LIGGAASAGAGHTFFGSMLLADAAPRPKPCTPEAPAIATGPIAIAPHSHAVWSTDAAARTITAHRRRLARGRSIDVGGAPIGIAISPNGRRALVTTAFYDEPGLAVVDFRTAEVDRRDVGPEPSAVAFAPNGRSAYLTGGGRKGKLIRVDPGSGRVRWRISLGRHPLGLAILADGEQAVVALNGASALALVDLGERRVRRIKTAPFPREVAVSPDGTRAVVTHNGFDSRSVTIVDLEHRRVLRRVIVGREPAGVAYSHSGDVALVACSGSGTAVVLDGRNGQRRRTVKLGGAPRGVAVLGNRGVVADAHSGRLRSVRLRGI
jgi:DNA-binding beta-propeller fold protein YncE